MTLEYFYVQVEVVRNFPELFHRVPQDYLPKELGGSVEHNHSEWLEECMKHFKTRYRLQFFLS